MADAGKRTAMTNTTSKSCAEVTCDCNTMWSMAQQFSSTRLCTQTGEDKGRLVRDYAVRARRIAGTYARFYLETEEGGDKEKLGRYYWMALGAFASKTVACTFEAWQVEAMSLVTRTVWEGLGKGNFWLFCDISGWHWYRNMHPTSFEKCLHQRNATNYVSEVKNQIKKLPWNETALPTIRHFAPSPEIISAFKNVRLFETKTTLKEKQSAQLAHLLDIANHEQGVILQPLIYDDPAFARWAKTQRASYVAWASPTLELVFTHQCTNKHLEVKSVAPANTKLEDLLSRMEWIQIAAQKFHGLMITKNAFMHSALSNMAAWYDMPDPS
jgi:hypothetical protein